MWIIPDTATRARVSPAFFRPFVDLVLATGTALVTGDGHAGAALWLHVDAGADPDDSTALREVLIAGIGTENAKRFIVLDELLTAHHPGHTSHEYLIFVGTVPERQNHGAGTALLRHRLDRLDTDGEPAYLEASSARSAALYARLGFAPTGGGVHLPDGPILRPMWRPPIRQTPPGQLRDRPADTVYTAHHLPGDPA
jgi:GNAT superfamily N-acetyltransferase